MGRKTTTTVTETDAVPEKEELDAFDRARLEFRGPTPIKLTILRYDEGQQKYLKRVDYNPEAIDAEWIRKKWGPGSYLLRFHDAEDPRKGWSQVVDIAPDESSERTVFSTDPMMDMLREDHKIMLTALLARSGGNSGSGDAALIELIRGMQTQTNTILQSALAKPDTSGTIFTVFEKALQLASDIKIESEGGWMSNIGRIARDLLPALQELNRMRPIPAQVYTPPPAIAAGAPPPTPETKEKPDEEFVRTGSLDDAAWLGKAVTSFVPEIVKAAEDGVDPETVADSILQAVPPMLWPHFDSITVDRIFSLAPQLQPKSEWVNRVIDALKDRGEEDTEESS